MKHLLVIIFCLFLIGCQKTIKKTEDKKETIPIGVIKNAKMYNPKLPNLDTLYTFEIPEYGMVCIVKYWTDNDPFCWEKK